MLKQDNASFTSQKMIAISSSSPGTLMYTVPIGKTFFGKLLINPNTSAIINGVGIGAGMLDNVTLTSGAVVVNGGNGMIAILGVEQ